LLSVELCKPKLVAVYTGIGELNCDIADTEEFSCNDSDPEWLNCDNSDDPESPDEWSCDKLDCSMVDDVKHYDKPIRTYNQIYTCDKFLPQLMWKVDLLQLNQSPRVL